MCSISEHNGVYLTLNYKTNRIFSTKRLDGNLYSGWLIVELNDVADLFTFGKYNDRISFLLYYDTSE